MLSKFSHANTDTNISVVSFHNKLKTFYTDRRPNKRVDDLLNLLLLIEEDDYWRHKRDRFYNNPETKVSLNKTNEKSRHFKGVNNTRQSRFNQRKWHFYCQVTK